jgi:hypothetical protein
MRVNSSDKLENLFRLLSSTEDSNVQLAFVLAKGMGNPPEWKQRIGELLQLYNLTFKPRKRLNAKVICELNSLELYVLIWSTRRGFQAKYLAHSGV